MHITWSKKFNFFLILTFAFFITSCSTPKYIYNETEVYKTLNERSTTDSYEWIEVPYLITPEMQVFAKNAIKYKQTPIDKTYKLIEAMISKWDLNLQYDFHASMTAIEAFQTRKANCLAFTNLFVALSRSVGLKTVYVDVEQVDEMFPDSNLLVASSHICAGLYDGMQFYLIDFAPSPTKEYRLFHEIDDLEAIAHHYNNLAYSIIRSNRSVESLKRAVNLYQTALMIKPSFSRVFNNLGVVNCLLNNVNKAEFYFKQAIISNKNMAEAYCNLGGIAYQKRQLTKAEGYYQKAIGIDSRNPYYRYKLALVYMYGEKFKHATTELNKALRYNKEFARGYLALARIAYLNRHYEKALKLFLKAHSIDSNLNEASSYSTEIMHKICIESNIWL